MHKCMFLLLVLMSGPGVVRGQLLCEELFDYSPGSLLSVTASGDGWSSGWKADAALTTALSSSYDVTAGSLSNAVFGSRGLIVSGNRFAEIANGSSIMWRGLSVPIEWSGNSAIYFSALVNWAGNHSSSSSRIKFMFGDANTYFGLTADGTNSHKMRLAARNTTASTVYGADLYDRNITYLLVAKIQTVADGSDTISLSVFSPGQSLPAAEPTWDVTASFARSDTSSAFGYEHNLYSASLCSADELRIGRTWDDVTVPPSQIPVVDPLVAFLGSMDMGLPEMSSVKTCYDAGQYTNALNAWRDVVMADLRKTPLGEFGWHSAKTLGYQVCFADQLVGSMTEAEYVAYCISIDRLSAAYYGEWGLSGAPGTVPEADWLAVPENDFSANELASFKLLIPLTVRYWQYGAASNQIYASKWFESASDFSRSCYDGMNALPLSEKQTNYPGLQWNADATSALYQSWRVENIIKSMGVLAKGVPGGTKATNWMDSLAARADIPAGDAYSNFPAQQLADIASSLVQDHPIALKARYLTAGAVPNQRFSGIYALLLTGHFFDMFDEAQTNIIPQADAAMLDFVTTMAHPDGGMLEQSLNYNKADAFRMGELLDVFNGRTNAWVSPMAASVENFWRMIWALRGPTFSAPQIGNYHCDIAPEVWANSAAKEDWVESQLEDYPAFDPLEQQVNNAYGGAVSNLPSFTSVAFPYAGYYVQRSGWTIDDMSLFFMGGRPQRGHYMCDKNAVQLSAFGRDLLVAAGPPNYYTATEPTPADDYLSEQSSRKVNTILVDGFNQNRTNLAQTVYTNTVDALWHTSDHFDLVEGVHEQGYGIEQDVSHHRQAVFVKEAGLWVLMDNLLSADAASHSYRQIWNFQPYFTDGTNNVYGFETNEVLSSGNHLYTADNDSTNTPNVHLYTFGENVTFEKYYGSTNPVYGWYARKIGDAIPAVDVHAVFSGSGDRQLLTLIRPVEGLSSGISSVTDISSGVTNGFDCTTDSGVSLKVRSTLNSGVLLTAGGVTAEARALLVTTSGGMTRGIVLDAQTFAAGELDVQNIETAHFEFTVDSSGIVSRQNILIPEDFEWDESGSEIVPDYGVGTNDWYSSGHLFSAELFDYSSGTALSATTSGNGWSSGWKADWSLSTNLDASVTNVLAGSLSSSAFTSRGLTATGNQFSRPGNATPASVYRGMDRPIDWNSNSVTYCSALVNWAGNHSSSSSRIKFMFGDANTYFGLTADGTNANKMRLAVRNTTGATAYGSDLYDRNATYMLIAKIQTVADGSDTISLSVFSPGQSLPATEPTWDVTAAFARSGTAAVFGYEHNLYSASLCSVDELRIGRTWDDATRQE